jgi:hypothetical protein
MCERLRTSLVLAILPNFHSIYEFVENSVLSQVQIFMECAESQRIQILMEQSSIFERAGMYFSLSYEQSYQI